MTKTSNKTSQTQKHDDTKTAATGGQDDTGIDPGAEPAPVEGDEEDEDDDEDDVDDDQDSDAPTTAV